MSLYVQKEGITGVIPDSTFHTNVLACRMSAMLYFYNKASKENCIMVSQW